MVEKLNLASSHEVFKINDVEYQSDGEPSAELLQDDVVITNLYKGKLDVQQVTYENYTTVSNDVAAETNYILYDSGGVNKLIITDSGTDYNWIHKG